MKSEIRYVFDTDTCIYLLNGNRQIKERVAQVGIEQIAVTIVTKGELFFGAYHSCRVEANLQRVRKFFEEPCPAVFGIDEQTVEYFGRFKAELWRTGKPIGDIDMLIAGFAVSRGFIIVTNNTKHFERIPDVNLENWWKPPSALLQKTDRGIVEGEE